MHIAILTGLKQIYNRAMSNTNFVRVSTVIFSIAGIVHLYRAFNALPVNLMGWDVPVAVSWVAGIVALLLAYSGYKHWH